MKSCTLILAMVMMVAMMSITTGPVLADGGDDEVVLDGVMSLTPVAERSCVAVRFLVDETLALSGVRWFNNDGSVVFPAVFAASGLADLPPLYEDGYEVGEDVQGMDGDWSELAFSEPVASESEALYVVFQLPPYAELDEEGNGPGIGYSESDSTSCVYLSADGDEWFRLQTSCHLLVEAVYVPRTEGMVALSRSGSDFDLVLLEDTFKETTLIGTYPNPFTPVLSIAFYAKDSGLATVSLYDIRGYRVRRLLDEVVSSGRHMVQWYGDDDSGRSLASGVYFVRFGLGDYSKTDRVLLMK